MVLRTAAAALAVLAVTGSALAEPLKADAARRFVVGKLFSFTCFEGTNGYGRIFNDGSVAGVVKIQGSGPTRFMHLPPGTLFAKGEAVCSQMKGAFFNPCFNLSRTSDKAFRGTVSGFGFMYCDFTRGGREPVRTAATTEPNATPRRSIRHGRPRGEAANSTPTVTAAPVVPVTSAPLKPATPPVPEPSGIRSTIQP